jgi:tripartite-type tricarboxylate transporter receptor subunit TctC
MKRFFRYSVAALLVLMAGAALAQAFPAKPVRLIVPYPPGGGTDIIGRSLAQFMSESMGQPVIVDNRPGANGAVGTDLVAKSPPDGYTMGLAGSSTHVLNPLLYKLSYDPVKDFAPLGVVATTNFVILVNPQSPHTTLRDLLAWLKANPGKASYASFGNASAGHLAAEVFRSMAGVDMVHVPYKGSAPGQADLMAGQVELMFSDMSGMPHVKSGKLRALAMTGAKRSISFPEIPTVAEAGVPGYDVSGWFAVYAPAGTPKPIVDRLNRELGKALAVPDVRNRLIGLALEPAISSPEELGALTLRDREKWQKVIAQAKIKVE